MSKIIKRVETKDRDSVVMLYFDKVNSHSNIYGNGIVIYLLFDRNSKYFSFKLINSYSGKNYNIIKNN